MATRNFVVQIKSLSHLLQVARALLEMKKRAPKSLKLTLAIVAERSAEMRYFQDSLGVTNEETDPLWSELEEVCG